MWQISFSSMISIANSIYREHDLKTPLHGGNCQSRNLEWSNAENFLFTFYRTTKILCIFAVCSAPSNASFHVWFWKLWFVYLFYWSGKTKMFGGRTTDKGACCEMNLFCLSFSSLFTCVCWRLTWHVYDRFIVDYSMNTEFDLSVQFILVFRIEWKFMCQVL